MQTLSKGACLFAVSLSALAGGVDAIGFLQLGGHFVSFMSGNTTQLAVEMANGNVREAGILAGIVGLFVIGTMLGTLLRLFAIRSFAKSRTTVLLLSLVTVLLAAASISQEMSWQLMTIAFMTIAMGAENALFQRDGDVVVGLTYMTGTLVKMGQRLTHAFFGEDKSAWVPYFFLWIGLLTGGVCGAILFHHMGLHSLWVITSGSMALTLISLFFKNSLTETAIARAGETNGVKQ